MSNASESTLFPTIEEYKAAVKYFAETRKGELIHNRGPEHAGVIFTNLFEQSNSRLRIVAGSLTSPLSQSPEYLRALDGFLSKRNTRLSIILDSIMDKSGKVDDGELNKFKTSELYNILLSYPDKVQITLTSKRFYLTDKSGKEKRIHFAIGDDLMYRLETDIEVREAVVCFNAPEYAKKLSVPFDELEEEMRSDKSRIVPLAN